MTQVTGLYPGTFDPITNGHTDIIARATKLVDRLIIAVARNAGKGPLFSADERVELVRAEVAELGDRANGAKVDVMLFDNLLMHFAETVGARMIIRGLRAVSDFEYEFQMAGMNAKINPGIETVFLMASDRHHHTNTTTNQLQTCMHMKISQLNIKSARFKKYELDCRYIIK